MNTKYWHWFRIKWQHMCYTMLFWQPWPYIGYCNDGPLSRWFYKNAFPGKPSWSVESNLLGDIWSAFWQCLAHPNKANIIISCKYRNYKFKIIHWWLSK